MNENIYDIDYRKIVRWWTPKYIRKVFWLTWFGVMVFPIAKLHIAFLRYRSRKLYQLMITPQKCYLERLLNDRWDGSLRRIYIDDGVDFPPLYIYQEAELKPVPIYLTSENQPQWLYTESETENMSDDFIVFVPIGLLYDDAEMTSTVKAYKLAGTKFKIQPY